MYMKIINSCFKNIITYFGRLMIIGSLKCLYDFTYADVVFHLMAGVKESFHIANTVSLST